MREEVSLKKPGANSLERADVQVGEEFPGRLALVPMDISDARRLCGPLDIRRRGESEEFQDIPCFCRIAKRGRYIRLHIRFKRRGQFGAVFKRTFLRGPNTLSPGI